LIYEARHQPPLRRAQFLRRMLLHGAVVVGLIVASIALGMLGYRHFEQLSWIDAFLNTSMLLGGMGPIHFPKTEAGKLFAGIFALYAGLVFIAAAALLLAPAVHRLLHHFHWSASRDD
jgi:hypothetical protein